MNKLQNISSTRIVIYLIGVLVLALGLILNSKSNLGVSAIISVAYSASIISGINFGNTTLIQYVIFVVAELIIHTLRYKKDPTCLGRSLKATLIIDLLQLPFSIVFTRFMNLFSDNIPVIENNLPLQLLVLAGGITFTGVGAATILDMRLVPNPGDGIVQCVADLIGRPIGFTKNCFDFVNVCITLCIGLLFTGGIVGVGLGTICAVIGVGRIIAIFNRLFMDRLLTAAGL